MSQDQGKCFIGFDGVNFEVKVIPETGERLIKVDDNWVSHADFLDVMVKRGEFVIVAYLVALGMKKLEGGLK